MYYLYYLDKWGLRHMEIWGNGTPVKFKDMKNAENAARELAMFTHRIYKVVRLYA